MKFNFATLTEDEFNGFVQEAQQLSDQVKSQGGDITNLKQQLSEAQKALEAVTIERDALAHAKGESDRLSALTAQVAGLRERADQALAKQQCDPAEYKLYFGESLQDDVTKFGNDAIELTVTERWLSKVESAQPKGTINVRSLAAIGKESNGKVYQTTLTAENLAE